MIYNKHNFSIHHLQDKSNDKYGVHITKDFTEITNGQYVVRVYTPFGADTESKIEDLPDVEGELGPKKDFEGCIVAVNVAKEIEKIIPNYSSILGNTWVTEQTDEEYVGFCATNLDITTPERIIRQVKARIINERYPDVDGAKPKEEPTQKIEFNTEYMIKICQQFKRMGIESVKMDIIDATKALIIFGETYAGQKVEVLLMPMERKS
jgi:hypothetical protein